MRLSTVLSLLLLPTVGHSVELDPSFSADGKSTVAFDLDASKRDRAKRIFPYSTGGYLLVGTASNNASVDVALASIADNGSLSTLMGGDGRLNIDLGAGFDLRDATVDSAGRIVLVARYRTVWASARALALRDCLPTAASTAVSDSLAWRSTTTLPTPNPWRW